MLVKLRSKYSMNKFDFLGHEKNLLVLIWNVIHKSF